MKKKIKIALTIVLFGCLNPCFSQWLEIHQIGRGDGDSALILGEDLNAANNLEPFVVLIDGQRYPRYSQSVWEYVRDTVERRFPGRKTIDFVITSHIHQDHYGGMVHLFERLREADWRINGVVDQFSLDNSRLDITGESVYECYDDVDYNDIKNSKARYYHYVNDNLRRVAVQPANNLFFLKGLRNISMRCLAANGGSINQAGNPFIFLKDAGNGKFKVDSENDLSFVWMLSFQGFNYFTGGDIGGGGGVYVDGETPITRYMGALFKGRPFHMCALKVSHHGSRHSTNDFFLNNTNPTLAVVPANLRTFSGTALPTLETLQKLTDHPTNIRYAFIANGNTIQNYSTARNLTGFRDVMIHIPAPPGFPAVNEGLRMRIVQQMRDTDYVPTGGATEIMPCTKDHTFAH